METIFLNSKKINISDFDFFDLCIAKDDVYSLYNKYSSDEKEIYNYLIKDSKVFILFNKYMNKYAKDKIVVKNFEEAEEYINGMIRLQSMFPQPINSIFTDNFCFHYKLTITKDNRLMFVERNTPIFNNNDISGYDFKNKMLAVIQLFKMVNKIKNYERAVELLCSELNIEILGEEMMIKNNERNKIANNLGMLSDLDRYPHLKKMIKKNKFVLEAINLIGINNTFSNSEHTTNNDMIVLCTSNYLSEYLNMVAEQIKEENQNDKSKTLSEAYLRRLMILYTGLGLIKTTNPTEKLLRREKKNSIKTKSYKYYTITELNHQTLLKADELAEKFLENGITAANVTNSKINYILTGKKENVCEKNNDKFFYDFSIKGK